MDCCIVFAGTTVCGWAFCCMNLPWFRLQCHCVVMLFVHLEVREWGVHFWGHCRTEQIPVTAIAGDQVSVWFAVFVLYCSCERSVLLKAAFLLVLLKEMTCELQVCTVDSCAQAKHQSNPLNITTAKGLVNSRLSDFEGSQSAPLRPSV